MVFHTNFISCRVSFVLRCFYKSTLVVTVSRFVQLSLALTPSTRSKIQKTKLLWFHTRTSKVHFRSSEGQTFYWSIMTDDDSIKCRCVNSCMTGQVNSFQNRGVCLQAFSSFLHQPLPALLLAPFFQRSLTLVPLPLLVNCTETLATQATETLTELMAVLKASISGVRTGTSPLQ